MKKLLFTAIISLFAITTIAQSVQEDLKRDIRYSASNQMAYPTPTQALTPAPEGYKPFYISHYGRHGSRYLINPKDYSYPHEVLKSADSAGVLTPLGKNVLKRYEIIIQEADNRYGELTPLGAEQHRQIARRMYERFPEVFEGNVWVDAKSTVVIRCILSMTNELTELTRLNPKLRIRHDASMHDMYYMNFNDKELLKKKWNKESNDVYEKYFKEMVNYDYAFCQLFTDTSFVWRKADARKFYEKLFHTANNLQNLEARKKVTLYDLFTDEDIYNNWRVANMWWYLGYGFSQLNGGKQPYVQRNLLRKIIEEADSCIVLQNPGATLRFGHETMVMPLTVLMGLNGYDLVTDDYAHLDQKGWVNYRIFPMGANIQLVFYRRNTGNKDVLVKVLLNENEATLPIKSNTAPYYKWSEVRDYYIKKIESYKE
ncbi:MAG: histidine-type phosphatase [Prevotella sp.]|nr:histidine phosphatase family protein [Prevotella sp.]MDD7074915.1 histidine-type phosphatase [Prevotellaceae bacterium]MDY4556197.1 histidine-type phosphatase [Prevotella sp.]MDY5344611.1 histidine-type phosphatase [Prevotella sp.]